MLTSVSGWLKRPQQTSDGTTMDDTVGDTLSLYCGSSGVTSNHLNSIRQIKFYTTVFPSVAWSPEPGMGAGPAHRQPLETLEYLLKPFDYQVKRKHGFCKTLLISALIIS